MSEDDSVITFRKQPVIDGQAEPVLASSPRGERIARRHDARSDSAVTGVGATAAALRETRVAQARDSQRGLPPRVATVAGRPATDDTGNASHGPRRRSAGAAGPTGPIGAESAILGTNLLTNAAPDHAVTGEGRRATVSDSPPDSAASEIPASTLPPGADEAVTGWSGAISGFDGPGSGTGGGGGSGPPFADWSLGDAPGCFDLGCSNILLVGLIGLGTILHLL